VDVSVAFNLWLALKSDGTLWAWGRNAHTFTGASQDACEIPTQIGHETDWQSIKSSRGGFYHLLKKRDGTFWKMDASHDQTTVKLSKVDLPPDVVAWDAGGGAITVLTQDGGVWACGTSLGQHGIIDRFVRIAEELCWRVGWKVHWRYESPRIVREQPKQLRIVDPRD
jgi:alpha-tubulin suppressor-like RCC1 family protein